MMTPIHGSSPGSGAQQARLNLERLRAAREKIQQQQSAQTPGGSLTRPQTPARPTPANTGFSQQLTQAGDAPPAQQPAQASPQVHSPGYVPNAVPATPQPPANTPTPTQQDALPQGLAQFTPPPPNAPSSPTQPTRQLNPEGRFGLPLTDIRHVAESSGFVGLTPEAIERAYATRKSLFIDTKI